MKNRGKDSDLDINRKKEYLISKKQQGRQPFGPSQRL